MHDRRLEDPFEKAPLEPPKEVVLPKGLVQHTTGFTNYYTQKKCLQPEFIQTIIYGKCGDAEIPGTFERPPPPGGKKKKPEPEKEEEDGEDPKTKAHKAQQASVSRMCYHEPVAGYSSDRPCACVYGFARHDKKERKCRYLTLGPVRFRSKESKEAFARLTGTKPAEKKA